MLLKWKFQWIEMEINENEEEEGEKKTIDCLHY